MSIQWLSEKDFIAILYIICLFKKMQHFSRSHSFCLFELKHLTERAHFIWLVMIKMPFFTSEQPKPYKLWSCQKMCDALHYLLDNIFIRFGSKLYRQIVGIPMGTNCAPLVADLFLFCYEGDFMLSLSDNNQADIIDAFNSTSRYLDDLLNIDNP